MFESRVPAVAVAALTFMKRVLTRVLAAAAVLSLAAPAQAAVTIENFTVAGPIVSGTFSLAFDDSTSAYSLSALNITLAGSSVAFDTSNSGVISLGDIGRPDFLEIGGNANGGVYNIGRVGLPPEDDFAIQFVPTTILQSDGLAYATAGSINYDSVILTAVPEPSTWAMMLIGMGAVGGALRAKRRRDLRVVAA
jgi:PEP-CTERM motif